MILEKIKVSVETSTNIKFIASISQTITIRELLPILLAKYLAVVRENYDQAEQEHLAKANQIKQITKNGYLIPLEQEVIHILNDNDSLFINLVNEKKNDRESQLSKKERLENKKAQKKINEQHKQKSTEEPKVHEHVKKQQKQVEKLTKQKEKANKQPQVKKSSKKQEAKVPQVLNNIALGNNISKLLQKIQNDISSSQFKKQANKQSKSLVIEEDDSSDE